MIKSFTRDSSVLTIPSFTGSAIDTKIETRFEFEVEVTVNDNKTTDYVLYYVDGKVRIVFNSQVSGKVEIKRRAKMNKIAVFGFLQGEGFWERFYDGLVQVLQDEAIARLEREGKQIGFYEDGGFVTRTINLITSNLISLYRAIRTMPLLLHKRIWRSFTSIGWFKNLYQGKVSTDYVTDLDFPSTYWTYPLLETNAREFPQNKLTGVSDLGDSNFTFIKSISNNEIVLYRFFFDPLERFQVLTTIGTEGTQAKAFWGSKEIDYLITHRQEQLVLTKVSESSIILSAQNSQDVNTLSLLIGEIQIPLIIRINKSDEGVVG